jgi:hypothetical protein
MTIFTFTSFSADFEVKCAALGIKLASHESAAPPPKNRKGLWLRFKTRAGYTLASDIKR